MSTPATITATATEDTARRDALVERVFQATLGMMDLVALYIGDRLGLYRALADLGPATSGELAARTDLAERYVREWLEQQAVAGLADRVAMHVRDATDPALAGRYDLVTAFECIHDMAQPVEALRAMRRLVRPDGVALVVDERVAETFTAPGDDVERLMYGFSVLHCLPVGLAGTPSAGTGTVMRPDTLRRYASAAGFRAVEILPIAHDLWRFYRLIT